MTDAMHPGSITFNDTASAGNANITNVANSILGTSVQFLGASTAGNATITNNPGAPAGEGGTLFFGTLGGTDVSGARAHARHRLRARRMQAAVGAPTDRRMELIQLRGTKRL